MRLTEEEARATLGPWEAWTRKPLDIEAVKLTEDVEIEKPEGFLRVASGDYLIFGFGGQVVRCREATFHALYEQV